MSPFGAGVEDYCSPAVAQNMSVRTLCQARPDAFVRAQQGSAARRECGRLDLSGSRSPSRNTLAKGL